MRDKRVLAAVDGKRLEIDMLILFRNLFNALVVDDGGIFEFNHIHLKFPTCEIVCLCGGSLFQEGDNLLSCNVFRRYYAVNAEVLVYPPRFRAEVLHGVDAYDDTFCPKFL